MAGTATNYDTSTIPVDVVGQVPLPDQLLIGIKLLDHTAADHRVRTTRCVTRGKELDTAQVHRAALYSQHQVVSVGQQPDVMQVRRDIVHAGHGVDDSEAAVKKEVLTNCGVAHSTIRPWAEAGRTGHRAPEGDLSGTIQDEHLALLVVPLEVQRGEEVVALRWRKVRCGVRWYLGLEPSRSGERHRQQEMPQRRDGS